MEFLHLFYVGMRSHGIIGGGGPEHKHVGALYHFLECKIDRLTFLGQGVMKRSAHNFFHLHPQKRAARFPTLYGNRSDQNAGVT